VRQSGDRRWTWTDESGHEETAETPDRLEHLIGDFFNCMTDGYAVDSPQGERFYLAVSVEIVDVRGPRHEEPKPSGWSTCTSVILVPSHSYATRSAGWQFESFAGRNTATHCPPGCRTLS